jgi:hypothetical protein
MKVKFPKSIYVYAADWENGKPIFAIGETLSDVDEGPIATYERISVATKITKHEIQKKAASR